MSRSAAVQSREIFQTLESEILNLVLKPGEPLSENVLCERFGVSRSPIRSVLQELRLCGLVTVEPYHGTYVTRMDLDIINQLIYQRMAVETFVLEDFCLHADELELQRLRFLNREMLRLAGRQELDAGAFYKLDGQFHEIWFASVHKSYLWACIQQSDRHYTRFRMLDIVHFGSMSCEEITQEHQLLIEAVERQDAAAFRPILKKHLFGGITRLGGLLLGELQDYFVSGPRQEALQP